MPYVLRGFPIWKKEPTVTASIFQIGNCSMPINLLKVGVNLKIQEANEDRRNDYVNNHDKPNSKNTWIFWKFWLVIHSSKGELLKSVATFLKCTKFTIAQGTRFHF